MFDNEIRKKIFDYISKYPGLHFREISRKLNIPKSTVSYHLKFFEKNNLITSKNECKCTRFYIANTNGAEYKKILHFIRQDTPCNILLYMIIYISATQAELSLVLEKHPTTINTHLKRLCDAGIIQPAIIDNGVVKNAFKVSSIYERIPITQEKIYIIKNRVLLNNVILENRNKLFNHDTKKILDMIKYLTRDPLPKKLRTSKNWFHYFEKSFTDIFPHPYHV
jgi:DNA-binding MarR family transcriptional regulator